MKSVFQIRDSIIIDDVLSSVEYGTLALCVDNTPYSIPLNFVHDKESIYFHGSKKGKKMQMIYENTNASFSVVQSYSIIQSYFSSNDLLACPATHFFKSIIINGQIEIIDSYEEKVKAMSLLMEKLQKEGGYKPFTDKAYEKMLNAVAVYKLNKKNLTAKFKFGQNLSDERFDMVIEHLKKRNTKIDNATIEMMLNQRIL
ncbi:pyridoxamine 5'-phosphate oxidase family protein [Arcobacter sp. s6]|uniref:pyridoxamine 5'-phosphate oxidase family protein n=1 Tax=Arcobacter sp. s6 TaxID=3230363 RepID=UPI0034A0062F